MCVLCQVFITRPLLLLVNGSSPRVYISIVANVSIFGIGTTYTNLDIISMVAQSFRNILKTKFHT